MISNDRKKYKSAAEWLAALRQDELWHNREERLQAVDSSKLASFKSKAIEELGNGVVFSFWEDYNHDVEKVIHEGWDTGMSLVNLKRDALNILTLEWLEKQAGDSKSVPEILKTDEAGKLLEKLVAAEVLKEDWQPIGLSCTERALLALKICERLDIKTVWKTFGKLWGENSETLRSYKNKALDQKKSLIFQDKLKKVFD